MDRLTDSAKYYTPQKGQQGAALILAILITALIAILAVGATSSHWVTIKRSSNQLMTEQAYGYLRGVETMALVVLDGDLQLDEKSGTDTDNCIDEDEPLAQDLVPFLIDEGFYSWAIEDLSGRFNLNSLVAGSSGQGLDQNNVHQQRFIRLLQTFKVGDNELSYGDAESITQAVIDWGDKDQNPMGFGGAEDGVYDAKAPPYKTANQPFHSVSELRLIENISTELYEQLKDHVTVWPKNGKGVINVNTATLNVLQSLNVYKAGTGGGSKPVSGSGVTAKSRLSDPPLDNASAQGIQQVQRSAGFADLAAFKGQPAFSNRALEDKGLAVTSAFYLLESKVALGDYRGRMFSVIDRSEPLSASNSKVRSKALARSFTGYKVTNWCKGDVTAIPSNLPLPN